MKKLAQKLLAVFGTVILTFTPFLSAVPLLAAENNFDPNYILSDAELQDWNTLNRFQIQDFLVSKNSYLSTYETTDVFGLTKPASEIIYYAAKEHRINPKFLLATLQKEQSLISDRNPSQKQLDWATGYAVCDGCYLSDPKVEKHKGFGKQVDSAAGLMRWYYDNKDASFIKKLGEVAIIDGATVVPGSWATGFMYTYTPHLHGNKNFKKIWDSWFSQIYPNGTLLNVSGTDTYYLIQNGLRRRFRSKTALLTRRDPNTAIIVPERELTNYTEGPTIALPNYSLLKNNGKTYLVDYDSVREFASEEVVRQLGYNPQEIEDISSHDLNAFKRGAEITNSTIAPQGLIYQITDDNGRYYLLKDSTLYLINDQSIIRANFNNLPIVKKRKADLNNFEISGLPLAYRDGTLLRVKNTSLTYVIEDGKRRRLADQETFDGLGYHEANVITVTMGMALSIPEGDKIFLSTPRVSIKQYYGDDKTKVENLASSYLPSYLIAEYPSGKIIAGKNIDSAYPIAAFTKLMTAYESLQQGLNLNKATTYEYNKHVSSGNSLNLQTGEQINNHDLLNSLLVKSVNNTARMVAQATGLTENEFINQVNKRLDGWGTKNTLMADTTGLSSKNKASARDVLKIFTKVMEKNEIASALGKKEFTFTEVINKNNINKHTLKNTNKLLFENNKNFKVIAGKTGYTPNAGSVLVFLIESTQNNMRYTIITMAETNYSGRFIEPRRLANWVTTK